MRCGGAAPLRAAAFCAALCMLACSAPLGCEPVTAAQALAAREEVREMFFHAFDAYMNFAYPHDELKPLSCAGRPYHARERGTLDDALGGYYLTLVDSLSTLALMGERQRFLDGIDAIRNISFDRDVAVSVFEANIRVLGGLLSAHQLASFLHPTDYDASLLHKAQDLADRLLPAFSTPTGAPVHRINLKKGLIRGQTTETCPAAAGTFVLEMGLLSRLTGRPMYEQAALNAMYALWSRRSSLGLLGAMFDTDTGRWTYRHSGIGAGLDSYFEYLAKGYLLLDEHRLWDMFQEAYYAVQNETLWNGWHVEVNMHMGRRSIHAYTVSSLQAFWPSVQVLAGEVEEAEQTFQQQLLKIWRRYHALPEVYDVAHMQLGPYGQDYPLRPELVESAYHLYVVTRDPLYLRFGRQMIDFLQSTCRVACGFAAVADVRTKRLDDRMDSFFLAETLKYLFLLFDEALPPEQRRSIFCALVVRTTSPSDSADTSGDNKEHKDADPSAARICLPRADTVFTTEGHVLIRPDSPSFRGAIATETNDVCLLR